MGRTAGEKAYTQVWKTVSHGKDDRRKSLHIGMENSITWEGRQAEKLTHRYGKQYHMGRTTGGKAYTQVWKTVSRGQRRPAEKLTHKYGKQYHMGRTTGGKAYIQVWKTVSRGQRRQAEKLTHRYGKQYHVGKDGRRKSLHTCMENSITWEGRQAEKLTHRYGKQYHVGKDKRRKSLHTGMENGIMWAKTTGGKAYTRVWKTVSHGQRRQAEKLTHRYGKQYHIGNDGRRKSLHTGMENGIMWAKTAGGKAYTQVWKTVSRGQRRRTEKLTHRYGKQYHVGKDGRRKKLTHGYSRGG